MRVRFLFVCLLVLSLTTGCKKKHTEIVLSEAATSVWDDNVTVGAQFQLENAGTRTAQQLRLTSIQVDGGSYTGPTTLPTASLGDLVPGHNLRFDAILKLSPVDGSAHRLTVKGDYHDSGKEFDFGADISINPNSAPPGPVNITTGTVGKQTPGTATFPTPAPSAPFGPNSEQPVFVPIGPPRQLFTPTPTGTQLGGSSGGAGVQIPRNTSLRNAGVPPDPNAAAATADGVVLASYNSNISYSKDGGKTFTDVNLLSPQPGNPSRTTFFPESDGGFCCDQVVIYLPKPNLFVWLLQYNPITACATNCGPPVASNATFKITQTSRLRIAWATPAAASSDFWNAWTWCDLTGTGLGAKNNEWLDYPDLAFSDTFLYVAIDHGNTTPGRVYTGRRIIARLSLADITNTAATNVGYGYAELTGSNGLNKAHMIQGAPGKLVLGSLDNSSTLRVFTCNDSENVVNSGTIGISQIQQGSNYTSTAPAPDNSDWLSVSFPGNITGGVYRNLPQFGAPSIEQYLFAFDAGANSGGGRPRAYLRLETLTPNGGSNYKAVEEYDVWNNDYAFAMGGLGTDGTQIGITLAVGGGTVGYPQFSVGYKDDFVVYQVTNSNATQISRFGDYVCNRPIGDGSLFATEVYDVVLKPAPAGVTNPTCATVGCTANMRFIEYGRPPGPPIH
ncbi:MAG: hypothetical protein ACXV9Q_01170 [Chthoniobacterales bacterium]